MSQGSCKIFVAPEANGSEHVRTGNLLWRQKLKDREGTDVFEYAYNSRGQLIELSLNGTASAFTYDDNGNRLFEGGTIYDSQDRLLETNDWKYSYNASGHLQNKTSKINSTVYSYDYDEFGNLQAVAGPDGIQIDYVVDPLGRRIGKLKNGAFHKGWIYRDRLRPAAELDESGRIHTSFVYGSRPNVPDYIERDGRTYRIISDHIGSPHLVVDASTGAVAQKLTYDVWGRILSDSNPGFQPFGFAGGLYDPDTGLVRFGGAITIRRLAAGLTRIRLALQVV